MAQSSLSARDVNVLEKIKDPECDPTAGILIDHTLPSDPHIPDQSTYMRVSQLEKEIISAVQQVELQMAGLRPASKLEPADEYRRALSGLDLLIDEHPDYASARNNRAQILRRLYGDAILVSEAPTPSHALLKDVGEAERQRAGAALLSDLHRSIALLSPDSRGPLSPQTARTLAMAHTQRAAIYHMTSKLLGPGTLSVCAGGREEGWGKIDFQEAASRDFAMGGRHGNEVAKGLAVVTNPTARLCGQIVREAMRKEYGPAFAS